MVYRKVMLRDFDDMDFITRSPAGGMIPLNAHKELNTTLFPTLSTKRSEVSDIRANIRYRLFSPFAGT